MRPSLRFFPALALCLAIVQTATAQRRAPLSKFQAPPEALREVLQAPSLGGGPLPYRVLLPSDYGRSVRRYPVLYLLHGYGGDESDWLTRTNLAEYAARHRLIIVTPGAGNNWYANSASDANARYEDAIVRDLIPHIDRRYRTIASYHGRAIAGLSMGGLGAMKFALRYPQLFAFAASFSGAFDVPRTGGLSGEPAPLGQSLLRIFGPKDSDVRRANDLFALLDRVQSERTRLPYLYVATGTNDPLPSVRESNPRFADALRAKGVAYEYHERPGTHDWKFWDTEIRFALERMSEIIPQMRER